MEETSMSWSFFPTRIYGINKIENKYARDVHKLKALYIAVGNSKWFHSWEKFGNFPTATHSTAQKFPQISKEEFKSYI